ncbi:MAG TPA: GntR family transcriptional regulator [Actinomycetota bacterium]
MRVTMDRSSPEPLWEQLSTVIAERIRRGSLAPGTRLPPVRALAGDLELAPNTVAKAYRALEDQGLIVGRGRRGTFVTDRLPKRLTGRELRLGEAADAFVRRGRQLGFGDDDIRRALIRTLRERLPS